MDRQRDGGIDKKIGRGKREKEEGENKKKRDSPAILTETDLGHYQEIVTFLGEGKCERESFPFRRINPKEQEKERKQKNKGKSQVNGQIVRWTDKWRGK